MGFHFEWYDREAGAPTVSIAEYGLVFNQSAIELLGTPEMIAIGFDKNNLALAIKPISKEDTSFPESRTFPFAERIRNGEYARINNKDFVRYVSLYMPNPIIKSLRCIARWDEENGYLFVDLKQHITDEEVLNEE